MSENQKGVLGTISPRGRSGEVREELNLLPKEIRVIQVSVGIRHGTEEEFRQAKGVYEQKVAELADKNVDMIHVGGAPPMMVHGFRGEEEFVKGMEKRYKTPIYTAGRSQSDAFRALGMKSFVGLTYYEESLNQIFTNYFTEAGFEVQAMEGMDISSGNGDQVSKEEICSFAKGAFLKHAGKADGIYMLGSGWKVNVMEVAPLLEDELQVPVVHAQAVKIWSVLKHFHIHRPIAGYGRLLKELP